MAVELSICCNSFHRGMLMPTLLLRPYFTLPQASRSPLQVQTCSTIASSFLPPSSYYNSFITTSQLKCMNDGRVGVFGGVLQLLCEMSDNISFSSNRTSIQKYKIVLVGDQNVGKSSIIARYIRNEFDPTKNPTIGIDFISKNIATAGKIIRLQLWDTAGQERFKSLIPSYLKDAHMALVVFDLASMPSAESIPKWVDFIREAGKKDIKIYVIGNKSDLENEISPETRRMAEDIADKQAEHYREVSAKTSSNIEDLFTKIIEDLLATNKKKDSAPTLPASENDQKPPASEAKEAQPMKLGSVESKNLGKTQGGCCQK